MARLDSENGWQPARLPEGSHELEWRTVPGTSPDVHLQVMKGWAATVLLAWAADMNAFVEHMRDEDSCCYTPTNKVGTSNHLNATGFDFNWNSHQFHEFGTFNSTQMATLDEMFRFYSIDGITLIGWGGKDWGGNPQDEMHFQMGYNTWNNPKVLEWIRANIRPDGFSTFRRGGEVGHPVIPPPAYHEDPINVLARAANISQTKAIEILPTLQQGLHLSECTNSDRIAMWIAQLGHESVSFVYTEEIAKNGRYAPYIGRTWIQITWDYNYKAFSEWCYKHGLVPTDDYFYVHYQELADVKWAGIGSAWYWVVERPNINPMCDKRDLYGVTQAINGGQNGASDRKRRYDIALSLGDQLLALIDNQPQPEEDDMANVPQEQWDRFYAAYMNDLESLSPLRKLGEGTIGPLHQIIRYIDSNVHQQVMELLASLGYPPTIQELNDLANADLTIYPDRADGKRLATNILYSVQKAKANEIEDKVEPEAKVSVDKVVVRSPEPVYLPAPVQPIAPPPTTGGTIGQATGYAIDALVNLTKAQEALGPETLAAVDAALLALQAPPTGE